MADRLGSIEAGKTASMILVERDASKDMAAPRHVATLFLDDYQLSGDELRKASGFSAAPE